MVVVGLGKGKQNSLRILPKYGEELEKKRKELRQRQRQEGRRKMCDRRGSRARRKECDKERCDRIIVPKGMQVV